MKRFAVIVFLLAPFALLLKTGLKKILLYCAAWKIQWYLYAKAMIFADDATARFRADSIFIKRLVKTLSIPDRSITLSIL